MIHYLNNPCTKEYQKFKDMVHNDKFPWYYRESSTKLAPGIQVPNSYGHIDQPFFSHGLLNRPDGYKFTRSVSSETNTAIDVISEIIVSNDIPFLNKWFYLRMCLNLTYPCGGCQLSMPHQDHDFPHYNFLLYLTTNSKGRTFIGNESVEPEEDKCILFTGEHYLELPEKLPRIVLVATIFSYESKPGKYLAD
tara:strand:+ start:65 stop:643 length:579 start_codon:yes stop_codon:yes gene_type:complete